LRLYSTPESALAGEPTVLAILETIAATAFSVWLVVYRGTLTHVVIGACIAPFLLLKTEESTRVGLAWGVRLTTFVHYLLDKDRFFTSVLGGFAGTFAFPLIRPLSIAFTAIRSPLSCIRAIPQNWTVLIFATDLHHPPEILPGIETTSPDLLGRASENRLSVFWLSARDSVRRQGTAFSLILGLIFFSLVGAILFIPALIYRYSLKATAIVYLPILWVLHDSLVDASSFTAKLEDIAHSPLERLKRWYSGFVLIFLVLVPAIVHLTVNEWWRQLSAWMQHARPEVLALLSAFVPTTSGVDIHAWHLARGINAGLTFLLFLWAYSKLGQMQRGTLITLDRSAAVLNVWLLIRGLLTLYIIGCTLYIVIAAVTWRDLWPVHIRWFPWK
jgi:hypothetical protein